MNINRHKEDIPIQEVLSRVRFVLDQFEKSKLKNITKNVVKDCTIEEILGAIVSAEPYLERIKKVIQKMTKIESSMLIVGSFDFYWRPGDDNGAYTVADDFLQFNNGLTGCNIQSTPINQTEGIIDFRKAIQSFKDYINNFDRPLPSNIGIFLVLITKSNQVLCDCVFKIE